MKHKFFSLLTVLPILALATVFICASRGANIVIDTGPGYTGFPGGLTLGTAPDGTGGQSLASRFEIPSFTHVTAAAGWIATLDTQFGAQFTSLYEATLTIGIASDAGSLPGSLLFQSSTTVHGSQAAGWTGLTGLDWGLLPGTYWINFSSTDPLGYMPLLDPSNEGVFPLSQYAARNPEGLFPRFDSWYDYNATLPPNSQQFLGVQIVGQNSKPHPEHPEHPHVPDAGSTLGLLGMALTALGGLARLRAVCF
jgi:VPDSG-CTERM motif